MDATNQKNLMILDGEPPAEAWPVFKGESFELWRPDRGPECYYAWADPDIVADWLFEKRLRGASRGVHGEFPRAYRQKRDTLACYSTRIAFRDVARATDTRTVIAALLPPNVFAVNTAPVLLWPRGDQRDEAYLLGVLSSIPLDWYARRFVELHLNFFIFNPLPVPRPPRENPLWQRAVALAGRLAAPDERFAEWADAVGVECGVLDPVAKQDMIDELDAVVAHLYGLNVDQLTHMFETFHEGWEYPPRLERVLAHFHLHDEAAGNA
jgi:hypothetical protein